MPAGGLGRRGGPLRQGDATDYKRVLGRPCARPRSRTDDADQEAHGMVMAAAAWAESRPGFPQLAAADSRRAGPSPLRLLDWKEVYEPFPPRAVGTPGRPLHGLRDPVLPQRLPARQPDPGVERPGLARATGLTPSSGCTRPTTSRSSPAAVPGAVRGGLRARHQRRPGDHQAGRGRDRRPGLGRGLGHPGVPSARPARRSPWSGPARPAWPPPSS